MSGHVRFSLFAIAIVAAIACQRKAYREEEIPIVISPPSPVPHLTVRPSREAPKAGHVRREVAEPTENPREELSTPTEIPDEVPAEPTTAPEEPSE
jgi:hypothetical protein